jgi:hypothetical protein
MWIVMSPEFKRDVEAHRLVFTCESCAHFCPERGACAVLYPTTPHRAATVEAAADGERIFFCKMFEAT